MIVERAIDCGPVYRRKRREFVALLDSLTATQLATVVPATPAWTVRDVLAHVVGITADLNAGRFDEGDAGPDAWTGKQVDDRRDRSVSELADEWEAESSRFEMGLGLLGYEIGSHYVADLLQHEQDVRQAIGLPRFSDDEALRISLDFLLDHLHGVLRDARVGVLTVRVASETFSLGRGPLRAELTGEPFELFRGLGGRRSLGQLLTLTWSGSSDEFVPLVSAYPPQPGDLLD
ncbi:MAG: maleylpyruvate isomerase family mycothiol-dependent enzyme [Ilumatobacter sp.]|uniref:maleylpyruvate isomerase family mycothiol-dependent enzyme n=1 Tax=Ilumatobacter sp. TaxID=1967498 RepID=UPI00262C0127|nr:maleylpyruvate isomerase family mycothiol-dependent enzyme [Ilumatobacter sp.]MDJ0770940.1 maleylpyruvate isomerase family mycothiol-dependent enzyme [Ilumatobacter sp.]